ncbi:MAG: polyprenyl synthetase family protein [Nocardioidaceae bacterium]
MTETVSQDIWQRTRELVEPSMRAALDRLDERTAFVCGYHLGYWDADGRPAAGSGKGVRAVLAVLSARAAGAPAEAGVPAAVAAELVHNFSLLHDDVMDGDEERRHRPTAWSAFGTSSAILAGDALLALANEILAENGGPTTAWAIRCLNACTRRLIAGQTEDLAFESRQEVSLEECIAMAEGKTGALLACAASLGAVLVDAPASLALALADYGMHLGLAFQVVDDLLGIWGTTDRTGKPVWSDLRARKKSLPVVAALTSGTPEAASLAERYAAEEPWSEADLPEVARLIEAAGGKTWAEDAVRRESEAALRILDGLGLSADVHEDLTKLTHKLSGRDY